MDERRKHPFECSHQEDWGWIRAFVENTSCYRNSLKTTLEEIRKENKDRFEILIAQIRADRIYQDEICSARERRIRELEHSRWFITGVVALITVVLIPVALAVIKI